MVDHKHKKLEDRAAEATFIGFTLESHGHKSWDNQKRREIVSRDVRFDECSVSDKIRKHSEVEEYA